ISPAIDQTVRLDGGPPKNLTCTAPNYCHYSYTATATPNTHVVGVSVPAGHLAQSTLCYNRTDCHTKACANNQPGCPCVDNPLEPGCLGMDTGKIGPSRLVNVPAGPYPAFYADLWWHYTLVNPWVRVLDGDVHTNHSLSLQRAPAGKFNARWLISARSSGQILATSEADWIARGYPERNPNWMDNTPIKTPSYATLLKRFGKGAPDWSWSAGLPTTNGAYKMAGGTVSASFTLPGNRSVLIFVDGNLTINAEIRVLANSVLAFIVNGEIRFSKNLGGGAGVDRADGLYLAQGRINTAYNAGSFEVTPQLAIEGALISLYDPSNSSYGTIALKRNLSAEANLTIPAETINLSAKYYVLGKSILGRPKFFWREVPAGF
ncbi:MAG: hypothetical protein Q8L46_00085, partial [candidate division WWE3 bacterium]|nr:hypothetical protein [candidate division WWE3 bacterium]